MKVQDAIKALQHLPQDEEICVLWWEKKSFDFQEDDDLILTKEGWHKVCHEFDQWVEAGDDIGEWISEGVLSHAGLLIKGLKK